ncbi:MAG: adenylate/guanylate cyclase domain-containing protein, partial [Betaproteobacteria bacterium]|nr:adenylate/guanylate cyclase domain-containing protein [Betaproteobacteria bacterium]
MSAVLDQSSRTFIGSVVFVDIIGYSKRTVSEQITLKDRFTSLLSAALSDIAPDQRLILDTGDGAALSFLGDPEDALFVSMHMRDMVQRADASAGSEPDEEPLPLRIGINLGPVKLVR